MNTLLSSPRVIRLAQRRQVWALAVLLGAGGLTAWGGLYLSPGWWGLAAGLLASLLLAGLVYLLLEAAYRLDVQAGATAELQRQMAAVAESNAALKIARQELAQQKMMAENLLAVARATGQQPVLENTLQNTLEITAALTGVTDGSLLLLDPNGRVSQRWLTHHTQSSDTDDPYVGRVLETGLASWAVRERQLVCVHNTESDPRWVKLPEHKRPAGSAVAVPFVSRGSVIGVLTLTHPQPHHFSEAHEKLLNSAADQIAVALDNAKMFNTMMRMADRMSLLYALSDLATTDDLDDALGHSLRSIQQAMRWPGLAVLVPDDTGQVLITHARLGRAARERDMPDQVALDDPLVSEAWRTQGAMVMEEEGAAPTLVAPIVADDRRLGVLLVVGEVGGAFNADDIELVTSAADTLAAAITHAELRRQVERLSQIVQADVTPNP